MNEKYGRCLGAPCLRGPGGVVKTIRLLTVVPSWDAEGQMVCSQQVITASMLIHWHPHKWVTRTTQSIWDAVIPSPVILWGLFYRVWHHCCAVKVVSYERSPNLSFYLLFTRLFYSFCKKTHVHKFLFSIPHSRRRSERYNVKGCFTEVPVC